MLFQWMKQSPPDETFFKSLLRTIIASAIAGVSMGITAYGLTMLSFWMGWLEKMVCK